MSPDEHPAEHPAEPPLRASDAERDAAADRLRDAAGEGRLTLEELAERSEAAYSAVTRADIDQLLADLPAAGADISPARSADVGPATTARPPASLARPRRSFWGIMGGDTLEGPMRLSGETRIVNVMGGVDLDLSEAVLEEGELTLRIYSLMGGTTLHVPHGVHVERTGFSLMGGDSIEPAVDVPVPGAPVIYLHSVNVMGGNDVKRGPRKPRRWPWQRHLGDGGPPPPEQG